jgi:hypothetical protein
MLLLCGYGAACQDTIESVDSIQFHLRYDSILSRIKSTEDLGSIPTIRYYSLSYTRDRMARERYGSMRINSDSIIESFVDRTLLASVLFKFPPSAVRQATFKIGKTERKIFRKPSTGNHYYIQSNFQNAGNNHRSGNISLLIISDGENELSVIKYGYDELAYDQLNLKGPSKFAAFFEWIFNFDASMGSTYPRLRGIPK